MVSCGVVWCRVVSCGVVWCRVVSCGVVWCCVVLCPGTKKRKRYKKKQTAVGTKQKMHSGPKKQTGQKKQDSGQKKQNDFRDKKHGDKKKTKHGTEQKGFLQCVRFSAYGGEGLNTETKGALKGGPEGWCPEGVGPRRGAQNFALAQAGLHTTAREPKRAHPRVPAFKNTTKIPRKDPQEGRKNENCGGRGKKKRNFRRSGGGPSV